MKAVTNERAPHRAIIWIRAEVHELLPSGECTGRPASEIKQFALSLDGLDLSQATVRLNTLLEEVKTKCRTSP